MPQLSLLPDEQPKPSPSLGEPTVWIQRLLLLESLEVLEPIRDIEFRCGLNIVATKEALASDSLPVGHDVGKTMLIRIIRYCLGEEHYCDAETREAVTGQLPDSYALARFRVAGESWSVARPLGRHAGTSCSWCEQTDDLGALREPKDKRRFSDFVEALNQATAACYADMGLPHAEGRRARWQDLLGWLSRDQECLFRHHAEWRVPESQAGPRVLAKEDSHLVMRMALGLLDNTEIAAAQQYEGLRVALAEKEARAGQLAAFLERTGAHLRAAFKAKACEVDGDLNEGLLSPALISLADDKIRSLSDLLQDIWTRQDVQQRQVALDAEIEALGTLRNRVSDLSVHKEEREKELEETKRQDDESFLASLGNSAFNCPYWPGDKNAAQAAGCPGEDEVPQGDGGNDLRRRARIHSIEQDLVALGQQWTQAREALDDKQAEVNTLRRKAQAGLAEHIRNRDGVAQTIGSWGEIKQQVQDFQAAWQEHDALRQELENKDVALRAARAIVVETRGTVARDLGILSACYQGIVRSILSQEVTGEVILDGNGIRPKVTGASSSGTTLRRCTQVLGFDLACLKASLCGVGHLPRIWMHDSPRAADTEDVLYHRLMKIVGDLEAEFENHQPTFQHIWTTTSMPPDHLNSEPYIRLRLHARDDSGKLLRTSLSPAAGVADALEESESTE